MSYFSEYFYQIEIISKKNQHKNLKRKNCIFNFNLLVLHEHTTLSLTFNLIRT